LGAAQLYEANEDQKQRYLYPALRGEKKAFFALTEPSGGSDPARAIESTGRPDGDDWILHGTKLYIADADRADFGITFVRTGESKGRDGITCFLVDTDTPGFKVTRVVHSLRNSKYATEIVFDNMRVPGANVLGELNGGFAIANDRLMRERIPYSANCVGVAIKAQQMAIEYAKTRVTFGAPLATRQSIQWMIVDNEIDIRQSRWLLLAAAAKAERGERFTADVAMAKLVATEAASRVVDRAMQIHGGAGVTKDYPFDRWYREMRIRRIGEGPSEVQRLVAARELIGGSFK
jgi:alkylation response protein AidB-like acyl-CoA dehydrogenase